MNNDWISVKKEQLEAYKTVWLYAAYPSAKMKYSVMMGYRSSHSTYWDMAGIEVICSHWQDIPTPEPPQTE